MDDKKQIQKKNQESITQNYQQPKIIIKSKSFKFGLKLDIPDSHRLQLKVLTESNQNEQKKQSQDNYLQKPPGENLQLRKKSVFEQQKLKKQDRFLKKYRVAEQTLGQGANGIVKKCTMVDQNGCQITYAFKITKCELEQKRSMIASFQKITEFDHENIIKYQSIYISTHQNKAYLVMEYLPWKDLSKAKIKSQEQLKLIAKQIIGAVAYMHKKGVCHRDLKPQNILYDPQTKKIKIVDFGCSAIFRKANKQTQMGTPTGTMLYRPPQRMGIGGSYNELVDEWAIGVILYQLVVGKTPFVEYYEDMTFSNNQTNMNIQSINYEFDENIWKNYSKELKQLVKQFLKPIQQRLTAEKALQHIWFPGYKNHLQSTHFCKPKKTIKTTGESQQPMTSKQKQDNSMKNTPMPTPLTSQKDICQSEQEQYYEKVESSSSKTQSRSSIPACKRV